MTCAKNKLGASSDLNVKIIKTQNVKRVKKNYDPDKTNWGKFRFGENVKNKQIVLGVKKYDLGKTNWGWDSD